MPVTTASTIPALDLAKALRHCLAQSRQQWRHDGQACDLAEYEDAGMAALTGCLQRYDPSSGAAFSTYAYARMRGAIHDAPETYAAWHTGKYWRGRKPHADLLRPTSHDTGDVLLQRWFVRQMPTIPRLQRALLGQLLQGESLLDIAEADGVGYNTIYARYRGLLATLKARLLPSSM
jgi:hypothetical protein